MSEQTVTLPQAGDSAAAVRAYVAQVRAALVDLPPDDLDDLTSGLEADLTEMVAETRTLPAERLGAASDYAAELRAAAGLPPADSAAQGPQRSAGVLLAQARQWVEALPQRTDWIGATARFLITLRPAWWVLRGWLLVAAFTIHHEGGAVQELRPGGYGFWLAIPAIVVSVLLGLRSSGRSGWRRRAVIAGNALLVALAWPIVSGATSTVYVDAPPTSGLGLAYDSSQIQELYVYAPDGQRLTNVRVFDESGHSLPAFSLPHGAPGDDFSGFTDIYGSSVDNVYSLSIPTAGANGVDDPAASLPWMPPASIPPLAPLPTATSAATTSTTPAPASTTAATVSPTASASISAATTPAATTPAATTPGTPATSVPTAPATPGGSVAAVSPGASAAVIPGATAPAATPAPATTMPAATAAATGATPAAR